LVFSRTLHVKIYELVFIALEWSSVNQRAVKLLLQSNSCTKNFSRFFRNFKSFSKVGTKFSNELESQIQHFKSDISFPPKNNHFTKWDDVIILLLLLKALVRRAIFASNITIKRYCNKTIFFFIVWIENLNSWLFKLILKSKSNILSKKNCFCRKNIASSILLYHFIAILLVKIARLTRA
jgi:hypothetical protein